MAPSRAPSSSVQDALLQNFRLSFAQPTSLEEVRSQLSRTLKAPVVLDRAALTRLDVKPDDSVQLDLDGVRPTTHVVEVSNALRPDSIKALETLSAPQTPLNVAISSERSFSGVTLSMARVKAIAAKAGGKVNDVVLALSSGMLRRYLDSVGALPKKSLTAASRYSTSFFSERRSASTSPTSSRFLVS